MDPRGDGVTGGGPAVQRPAAALGCLTALGLRVAVPITSGLLVLVSLALPAFTVQPTDTLDPAYSYRGIYVLALGWLGPLFSPGGVAWYANPVLVVSLGMVMLRFWRTAAAFAGLALALAACTFALGDFGLVADVPPSEFRFLHVDAGFVLWSGAMVVALVGSILGDVIDPGRGWWRTGR